MKVLLLWLLWLSATHAIWNGYWEQTGYSPQYSLTCCPESDTIFYGFIKDREGNSLIILNAKLEGNQTTGTCDFPTNPVTVDYTLQNRTNIDVFVGSVIKFDGYYEKAPFNLSVVTTMGLVLFEALNVPARGSVYWSTNSSLLDNHVVDGRYPVNWVVYWGLNKGYIQFRGFGPTLVLGLNRVSCISTMYIKTFQMDFVQRFEGRSDYCRPFQTTPSNWLYSWTLSPTTFGSYWFVCPANNGGIISAFGDYFTEQVVFGDISVHGQFVSNDDTNQRGEFYFEFTNLLSFTGHFIKDSITWNIVGTRKYTYAYECSSMNDFLGFWIDSEHSSLMTICFDGQHINGTYFGGSFLINGWITYLFEWVLKISTYNIITGESSPYIYLLLSYDQNYLHTDNSWDPFATLKSRNSTCNTIPSTWGTYSDELFISPLFLCTRNNSQVYGFIGETFQFTGIITDNINVMVGEVPAAGLKFTWTINGGSISAEYIDNNGVSIISSSTKIKDEVTLSQCNALVLITAYTGSWIIPNFSPLYLCQTSDTQIEGRMGGYSFSGKYMNGILSGTYFHNGTTGNWTARTNLAEKDLVLSMDDQMHINGTKSSGISTTLECGWKKFWKNSFGYFDNYHPLGGCFFVCFETNWIDFNIIFTFSEIFGSGTIDMSTGTLMGKLHNGWIFTFSIAQDNITVNAQILDNNGTNLTLNYTPCVNDDPLNYLFTPITYPNCVPKRFEPTISLPSTPIQRKNNNLPKPIIHKEGVDITADGKMVIVASLERVFISTVDSFGNWGNEFELPQQNVTYHSGIQTPSDQYIGNPVAITNTHAFMISGPNVTVFQKLGDKWIHRGYLEPPCLCEPLYVIKSFSEGYCVVEVTWIDDNFHLSLYNVSYGIVDFSPFYVNDLERYHLVFSVALHPSWFVYVTYDILTTSEVKVFYCALTTSGLSSCLWMKLATIVNSDTVPVYDTGIGFSVAVTSDYLFVGYPSSQSHYGSVYVYKYHNHFWRFTDVIYPPEPSLHQLFGRTIFAKENDLIILKAIDSTLKPLSMALFSYTLSSSKWVPKFKFVSEDWASMLPTSLKRQFVFPPYTGESPLYWTMSNNGSLFITSPSTPSYIHVWYSCSYGFWGLNCSNPCPCQSNSSCKSSILEYSCICLPNTWGFHCENQCRDCNGAPCDDGTTGTGICLCNSSQYGPECKLCTCVNGLCDSGPNGTGLCTCSEGWIGTNCEIIQNQLSTTAIIAISVTVPIAMIILIGTVVYLCCRKETNLYDISDLPEEIHWYCDATHINSETGWVEEKGYLVKDVHEDKKYLKKLTTLLEQLDGKELVWEKAYAVFNTTLLNNFLGFRSVTLNRHKDSPDLFKKSHVPNAMRDYVMEKYNSLVKSHEWNLTMELPILPVIHGTSAIVAKSICATGFAALSSLDEGFYGKGIYATSSCLYALPYYATKSKPAILICLATPGNVCPIIEDHQGSSSWLGKGVASGFQSHYVLTSKDGTVIKNQIIFVGPGVMVLRLKGLEFNWTSRLETDCDRE